MARSAHGRDARASHRPTSRTATAASTRKSMGRAWDSKPSGSVMEFLISDQWILDLGVPSRNWTAEL
jgi:hypothetical protein